MLAQVPKLGSPQRPPRRVRVLVVDGEAGSRDALAGSLADSGLVGEVHTAADAAGALRLLDQVAIDVVFVEVDLPGLDGMDLARVFLKFACPPAVVFVADAPGRAAEAFEVGVVDFVVRPVGPGRLAQSLSRLRRLEDGGAVLAAGMGSPAVAAGGAASAAVGGGVGGGLESPVRWVEAQRGYTRLHTAAGSCLVSVPMGAFLAAQAGGGFVRIHRSYAVQVAAVSELRRAGGGYAVVVDGQVLPVSRRAAAAVAGRLLGGAKSAMPAVSAMPTEGAMAAERVGRVGRAAAVGPGRAVA